MKKLLLLGVVSLFVGGTALTLYGRKGPSEPGPADIREQLVGAWRLARLEEPGADGKIHAADSTGQLVFTREGHMSVQVMDRNPPADPQTGTSAAPVQYAQGGYEASFGTYEVDAGTHTFTFHVEGALVRTLVGKDLPRAFELSSKQLIVKSTNPEEHWRVTWERY